MTAISTNDPVIFADVVKNIRNESATVLSMVSMSFENLFMIRPSGVVSKKLIGACMTESIALRWRTFEAKYAMRPMVTPKMKNTMVNATPSEA